MRKSKLVLPPTRRITVTVTIPNRALNYNEAFGFISEQINIKKKSRKKGKRSHSACTTEQNTHNTNLDSAAAALVTLTALQNALPTAETNYATALGNAVQSGIDLDTCLNS